MNYCRRPGRASKASSMMAKNPPTMSKNDAYGIMDYDFIIIRTGAGGGTLLHKLAPTGKKILVLERGSFLQRGKEKLGSSLCFYQWPI